jgi:hypothetical protein
MVSSASKLQGLNSITIFLIKEELIILFFKIDNKSDFPKLSGAIIPK